MVYKLDPLDLPSLFAPTCAASAAVARLDERLARSPICDGWIERQHFVDACAALWLDGELVHVEDLVLHDAHMDIRMPTHELTQAHGVLRARRQIFGNKADWALSQVGMRQLTRRGGGQVGIDAGVVVNANAQDGLTETMLAGEGGSQALATPGETGAQDELTKALQAMDAALERSAKVLDGQTTPAQVASDRTADRPELVYDLDWDEEARLGAWQGVIAQTEGLPVVLRAAILVDAWHQIDVLQHGAWLGVLLVAALLRQDAIAAHHLPPLHLGAKQIPRERRRAHDRTTRLLAMIEGVQQAASLGLKEHDRLTLAKGQMERRIGEKRSNSRLPELINLALSKPLITSGMVQQALKVSKQGALNLIGELGLREITGRGRFRAWGV
jgi:Protein of unknown function (DUF1612)/HTH DNA binding domain